MSNRVNIYTDGSAIGNPGPGGYGIIMEWVNKKYVKEFSAGYQMTTNNRMELLAVIIALESLKTQPMNVIVFSDSKYVIESIENDNCFYSWWNVRHNQNWFKITVDKNIKLCMKSLFRIKIITFLCEVNC